MRGGTLIGTGILDCNPCVCGNREIVWNRESSMAVQCCLSFSLFLGRNNSGAMHCNAACAWHRVHRKCMLRMQRQQVQPALLHSLSIGGTAPQGPGDSYHVIAAQHSKAIARTQLTALQHLQRTANAVKQEGNSFSSGMQSSLAPQPYYHADPLQSAMPGITCWEPLEGLSMSLSINLHA